MKESGKYILTALIGFASITVSAKGIFYPDLSNTSCILIGIAWLYIMTHTWQLVRIDRGVKNRQSRQRNTRRTPSPNVQNSGTAGGWQTIDAGQTLGILRNELEEQARRNARDNINRQLNQM